jgi:hypothetical protein
MNKKGAVPKLALLALSVGIQSSCKEALIGDLIERFRQGKSARWFWRQTVIAISLDLLSRLQSYWPQLVYATSAVLFTWFLANAKLIDPLPKWLHWSSFSWPWSQITFELSRPLLLDLTALSTLAICLYLAQCLRWRHLFWTGLLSAGIIAFGHFSIDAFPFLRHSDPNDRFQRFDLVIPGSVRLLLSYCGFFLAAVLGCKGEVNSRYQDPNIA